MRVKSVLFVNENEGGNDQLAGQLSAIGEL